MGGREFNKDSPSYLTLMKATEVIFSDIRAGGPWSRHVVEARSPRQTKGSANFDGPARKPTLKERMKGLDPLPPSASVVWQDDTNLTVYGFGLPVDEVGFVQKVTVTTDTIEPKAQELVQLIAKCLQSIDPKKTEAIKIVKLPKGIADQYPWMIASGEEKRPDPWNE